MILRQYLGFALVFFAMATARQARGQMLINGAGATFPYPIYSKWFDEYAKVDPSARFNYQSIGSGGGQKQILAQTVDFGASDGPMSDANLAKAPGTILHVPTVAGAVVIAYNLPGHPQLKLDGPTLAKIFLGKITRWDDKNIVALNPNQVLPKTDLVVVHRSDGSGTTYIFSDYLSSLSQQWSDKVGRGTAVRWPCGVGAKGNEGVAGQIKQMTGTLGYIELAYAHQNQLAAALIKNSSGHFVSPSVQSVSEALTQAKIPDDFRFSMVNAQGDGVYPICGASWFLVYEQQKDAAKGRKIVDFLRWALSSGQSMAASLDYAPLPPQVRGRALDTVARIKY